jgi:hypothetical protein
MTKGAVREACLLPLEVQPSRDSVKGIWSVEIIGRRVGWGSADPALLQAYQTQAFQVGVTGRREVDAC